MGIRKEGEYSKEDRNSCVMNQIGYKDPIAAVCPESQIWSGTCSPRPAEEGKGQVSQNRCLTRTRESPPARPLAHGHVGPATPSAEPPADPSCYLSPAPGPRTRLHTHTHTHSAAQSARPRGSRRRLRLDQREREREREGSGWPPRWSTTLGWTPSRSGSCSRTSETSFLLPLSFLPLLLAPLPLLPAASLCVRVSAICLSPACSGTRTLDFSGAWGWGFRSRCLLRRISRRSERGRGLAHGGCSVRLTLCARDILYHVLVSPSHVFGALLDTRAVGLPGNDSAKVPGMPCLPSANCSLGSVGRCQEVPRLVL